MQAYLTSSFRLQAITIKHTILFIRWAYWFINFNGLHMINPTILINGAKGRMGAMAVATIEQHPEWVLVGQSHSTEELATLLSLHKPAIAIDFTHPNAVYTNTTTILEHQVRPIIGTTGLTIEQIKTLQGLAAKKKLGGIIAPNFSIGALWMMRIAQMIAPYFTDASIIEYHHPTKADSPSGTALQTKQLIKDNSEASFEPLIHSIRLPGIVAQQDVIFGNPGETLTIRHQVSDRICFMAGLLFACKQVLILDRLIYGLETLMFEEQP